MADRTVRLIITGDSRGAVRAMRETEESGDRTSESLDNVATKAGKVQEAMGVLGGLKGAFGPSAIPVLAAVTAGIGGLSAAFVPATIGATAFGAVFSSQVKAVSAAATAIGAAQAKINATAGPAMISEHTAAIKQLTVLNNQLVGQLGAGGPQIVARYAAMQGAVQSFKQSFNPQMFSLLGAGLTVVQRLLPQLRPLIAAVAGEFIKLTRSIATGINGSGFKGFMTWLTVAAPRGIAALAKITGNLGRGFIDLLRAFTPLSAGMTGGLVGMTAAFAKWSANLGTNSGFQKFLAYAKASGPQVASQIDRLAGALVGLAPMLVAAGNSSLILVNGLAGMIKWFSHVPIVGKFVGSMIPFLAITTKLAPAVVNVAKGVALLAKAMALLNLENFAKGFWAIDAAMDANPVGLIIIGVAALAAGFYLAYEHCKLFRDLIKDLGPVARVAFEPLILLVNTTILGINLVIKAVNLLIKMYDAIPALLRPTGKIGTIGFSAPMIGGNIYGGQLGLGALSGSTISPPSGHSIPATATTASAGAGMGLLPVEIHVHSHLDGRQVAESTARYNLSVAVRR